MLFIEPEEVGVVVKAHGEAGLTDGLFLADQIVEQVQPSGDEIFVGRNAHIIPEQMGDVVFGEMELLCQNIQRYILGVVPVDVVDHFVDGFVAGGSGKV